jgi:PhoPQ-activated pathogenicity-related protein
MRIRIGWVILLSLGLFCINAVSATPLDDYVLKPDGNYAFRVAKTVPSKGYTTYVIDMKSQAWRSEKEVNRTVWQHWLTVVRPEKVASDTAMLWITGGSNGRSAPKSADGMMVKIALASQTVVAEIKTVPNQPLQFTDDKRDRYEDEIIAYTFDKFVRTRDATWPLLLPMVKSAVRAMDTVQAHMKEVSGGKIQIEKFVVSGGSKRGWTTWLTAAVDKRVTAIVPVVIDVLNMNEQMKHHFGAYGFYSQAIRDYEDMNIFERMDTKEGYTLTDLIDPYSYRDRLTLPKFMVNGSGDQFFLPDSAQFYFHELKGEKYLRYVPNTDHSLGGSDAPESLLAFYASILTNAPRPRFAWVIRDNYIMVHTQEKPLEVNLWQATNPKARDFRVQTIGKVWTKTKLSEQRKGMYSVEVAKPKEGWTAFFVEMTYPTAAKVPLKLTTQVKVVPDVLPFAEKLKEKAKGKSKK